MLVWVYECLKSALGLVGDRAKLTGIARGKLGPRWTGRIGPEMEQSPGACPSLCEPGVARLSNEGMAKHLRVPALLCLSMCVRSVPNPPRGSQCVGRRDLKRCSRGKIVLCDDKCCASQGTERPCRLLLGISQEVPSQQILVGGTKTNSRVCPERSSRVLKRLHLERLPRPD